MKAVTLASVSKKSWQGVSHHNLMMIFNYYHYDDIDHHDPSFIQKFLFFMICMIVISQYDYDDIDHHYHSECQGGDFDCHRLKSKSGSRQGKNSRGKLKKAENSFDENRDATPEDVVDLTRVSLRFAPKTFLRICQGFF